MTKADADDLMDEKVDDDAVHKSSWRKGTRFIACGGDIRGGRQRGGYLDSGQSEQRT